MKRPVQHLKIKSKPKFNLFRGPRNWNRIVCQTILYDGTLILEKFEVEHRGSFGDIGGQSSQALSTIDRKSSLMTVLTF